MRNAEGPDERPEGTASEPGPPLANAVPLLRFPRWGALVLKFAVLVALVHFPIMLLLVTLGPELTGWRLALLDTTALLIIVVPISHFGLIRRDARMLRRSIGKLEAARREAEHFARVDGLTGVLGRHALSEVLDYEWQRTGRYHHPLSCLMIDVDDFKRVNDVHGHAVGDDLLRDFTRILLAHRRASDHVGRYGGDEFLLLLPMTDIRGGTQLAERIRTAIAATTIPSAGGTVGTTVSIGVAESEPGDDSAAMVVDRADHALLRAKQAGRNRVESLGLRAE